MNKPNLDNLTPEQGRYIEYLEGALSGSSNVIRELNLVFDGYASDLMKIRTNTSGKDGENLQYFKKEKDPFFDKVMVVLDKIDKIVKLESLTKKPDNKKSPQKEVVEETTTITTTKEVVVNPYEERSKALSEKIKQ
jgi:GTP-binding protein EngB required for normal cell division